MRVVLQCSDLAGSVSAACRCAPDSFITIRPPSYRQAQASREAAFLRTREEQSSRPPASLPGHKGHVPHLSAACVDCGRLGKGKKLLHLGEGRKPKDWTAFSRHGPKGNTSHFHAISF